MEIKVLCELENKRIYVGTLQRESAVYIFCYDKSWLNYRNRLALGPDLPLRRQSFRSEKLFYAFERRIPPKDSANYARYCEGRGISVNEKDLFILLGTVGHKGASSFVFELDYAAERQRYVIESINQLISHSSYEAVAAAFGVNKTGLYKLMNRQVSPDKSNIYSMLEICVFHREAAWWKMRQSLELPDLVKTKIYSLLNQVEPKTF